MLDRKVQRNSSYYNTEKINEKYKEKSSEKEIKQLNVLHKSPKCSFIKEPSNLKNKKRKANKVHNKLFLGKLLN